MEMHFDVLVAGAGPAGWPAAVAAARTGAHVALLEQYSFLGGAPAAGYVIPISGTRHRNRPVCGSITEELIGRLEAVGAAKRELPAAHVSVDPERLKLEVQRMVLEAGVTLFSDTVLIGADTENGRVHSVNVYTRGGIRTLTADFYIDATGDAVLSQMAGCSFLPLVSPMQPMSMCFQLENVDTDTPLLRDNIHHDGRLPASRSAAIRERLLELRTQGRDVPQFGGPWFNTVMGSGAVTVNITRTAADACDPEQLTQAECTMRQDVFTFVELLKEQFEEFRNCRVSATAIGCSMRETRRIRGRYVLTEQDLLSADDFEDTVAYCVHPVDIHAANGDGQIVTSLDHPAPIPYRCMQPLNMENMLTAGRCISAEQVPFATLRVQGTCMTLGQAAGIGAVQTLRTGTADVPAIRREMQLPEF